MPQRRSYAAAAEVDGRIYVAGGMVGETGRPLSVFTRFDPDAGEWKVLAPLPRPTRAADAAAIGRTIYVVGGLTRTGPSPSVFAYDVDANRWSARAPLPEPRFNEEVVALGGRLYVLGGYGGGGEHADVFVYDPARDRWRRFGRLPKPNHAFGAVAFHRDIWVIGGRRGQSPLRDVWILDPATGRWRAGPAMPKPMELLGTAVDGEQIHAVWESTYQIYDARKRRWSEGPPSLVARHALSAFVVDGTLYTIGGCTTQLRDSPVVERRHLPA
jgi:hypothetical protein